ncbi:indolepyruvate ferredoxin oxidoreductase family protein [Piscinibacter sp.]|uniref:indolepyruvate ferredoxin oxidoreductase family protein n=1 Tax=Piscinibacter sp. TaxID=1903157 RepID=UPI002ECFB628
MNRLDAAMSNQVVAEPAIHRRSRVMGRTQVGEVVIIFEVTCRATSMPSPNPHRCSAHVHQSSERTAHELSRPGIEPLHRRLCTKARKEIALACFCHRLAGHRWATDRKLHQGSDMSSPFANATVRERYCATSGRVYVSGIDALVRLMVIQRLRDQSQALNTAGFVSGYRGSPLGGLDEALWKAQDTLETHAIKFLPGVNEELAATAVWGTQQLHLTGGSAVDGVFSMWYGKGPGVDRCGDVFKHMSHAGTAEHGGVLLVAGDDHGAYSSTLPNQSDQLFLASMVPVLYPSCVDEYIELGLHGFAMSRFAGLPVAFKALADTVESSASIDADPMRTQIRVPDDFVMPEGGVHCQASTATLGVQARQQEALMHDVKIRAVQAYARTNRLNRVTLDHPRARLGIVASGKSYGDVMEALVQLGIHDDGALRECVRVFRVAMPWPLEPRSVLEFAEGLEEILVVEEKRSVIEQQLKDQLYHLGDAERPRIVGKFGATASEGDSWLLSALADLSVDRIVRVLAARLSRWHAGPSMQARTSLLDAHDHRMALRSGIAARPAWYCAGCPHNTSTRVPEGSLALAGIGCHVMATAIYPEHNKTITHMGGEGATWLGQAWFSRRAHMFANLGDGTYFHSGSMAIRAAVAAGVSMTYKILYNDAVAMTGGQPVDGPISVTRIVQQLAAEGVRRIALVTADIARRQGRDALPAKVRGVSLTVHPRGEFDAVQRELRAYEGVSVLIYDQVCAAEKRRRGRRSKPVSPPTRAFINEAVCEGCGDCGEKSNCTAILPSSTEYGRTRQIDQSACNTDLSCVEGFCPSFVTIEGVTPRRRAPPSAQDIGHALPEPVRAASGRVHNILVTGVGGTGVITVGALIGMAAHLEGRKVSVLDMTGMSQKNGAVSSHVRIGAGDAAPHAQRIPVCEADLVLGCDLLTTGAGDALARICPGRTHVVVNTFEQPTGRFAQVADWAFPSGTVRKLIDEASDGIVDFVDATAQAVRLVGDALAANIFLLGYAFQKGLVPLGTASMLRAIELNGVGASTGLAAFQWGRRWALDAAAASGPAVIEQVVPLHRSPTLAATLADRCSYLTAYQSAAYAASYRVFVERVRDTERALSGSERFAKAVASNLFRLMAYKDEYEVARLHTHADLREHLHEAFDGKPRLRFHFAPPLWARKDAQGHAVKSSYGPWMWYVLRAIASLRRLRGTPLDPFGRTAERREERRLVVDYRRTIERLLLNWESVDRDTALALARIPERIRGFGHVKAASIKAVRPEWDALLARVDRVGASNVVADDLAVVDFASS